MDEAFAEAIKIIKAIQDRQKSYADLHRSEKAYIVGGRVQLETTNLRSETAKKLGALWVKPFLILQVVSSVA